MEEEITKHTFKDFYLKYAVPNSGWTEEYWNLFYEHEQGKKYFFAPPETREANRMFIISDSEKHRMIFLTEESEESFFDFPGKE